MVLLDVIKQEIGWESGISLPVANQKNKALEIEIQEQIREITLAKSQLDIQNEHVKILRSHLANVQEQLVETQNLKQAKQLEMKSEKDFQALLKTQESRIKQEKRRVQHELDNLLEKKSAHENSVSKCEERITLLREEIQWDEGAMDSWLEEAIRRDEDSNLLQTYANEDGSKIKELELRLAKLTAEVQQRKKTLDRRAIDLKMAQVDFDKTTAEYSCLHEQRTNYIRQWETTIEQMHERDEEVENYISELMKLKDKAASTEKRLRERELFLKERTADNRLLEQRIRATERAQVQLRQQADDEDKRSQATEKEVTMLNTTLTDATTELNRVQTQTQHLINAIEMQQQRIARNDEQVKSLKSRLSAKSDSFVTSRTEVERMDLRMTIDRALLSALQKELAQTQRNLAADTERLKKTCEHEKTLSHQLQGLKTVEKRVDATTEQLNREIYNHQQMLCIQDNENCKLEERIGRLEGSKSLVGQSDLQEKIGFLQKILDDKMASFQALLQETKQQASELRAGQKESDEWKKRTAKIESKLDEVNLQNDVGQRKLKEIVTEKKRLMVEENILKLELRRFREILTSKSVNVVSMEKQRMQLEAAIVERQQEISIETEITKAEIRMLEDARQRMIAELNDCRTKTQKLKNRCEVVLQPVKNWNCDGEATPVHFLMKVAEDKKELKTENEAMLSKVQRAEKDVSTFASTARLLQAKNEYLRKALQVTPSKTNAMDKLKEEKKRLDEEIAVAYEKLETAKRHYNTAKESLLKEQETLECVKSVETETRDDWTTSERQIAMMDAELREQELKVNRATQSSIRLARQLDVSDYERIRKDVTVRLVREQNRNAVASLADFGEKFPETIPIINAHFDKAQLPRPSQSRGGSLSTHGSSAGSVRTLPSLKGRSASQNSTASSTGRRTPSSSFQLPSVVNINVTAGSASNLKQAPHLT